MIEAPKFGPGQKVLYNGNQVKIQYIHSRHADDTEWYYSLIGLAIKESELSEPPEKFPMSSYVYYKNKKCQIVGRFLEHNGHRNYKLEYKNSRFYEAREDELSYDPIKYLIIDPIPLPQSGYHFRTTSLDVSFGSQRYTPKWKIQETHDDQ